MKVSDLIHPVSNTWNIDAIRDVLPHYEETIMSIELSSFSMEDAFAWLPVKSGRYSTKSGYAMAKINKEPPALENFDWKLCVWQINTAPKLKTFLWKLKNKAIAVGSNLRRRGISDIGRCKRCDAEEDEMHIILFCPFATRVWELAPVLFKPDSHTQITMAQFLVTARRQINLPPVGLTVTPLFPWILWNLWKSRNQFLFENRRISAEDLLLRSLREAKAWQDAQGVDCKISSSHVTSRPLALHPQTVLCFSDASWIETTRVCGMGWCFRDAGLRIINQSSTSRSYVTSALVGEALVLKAALIAATTAGYRMLSVFSDSLSLVTLINTNGVTNELKSIRVKSILYDIQCLRKGFNSILFAFVPRSENVLADALAKFGVVSLNIAPRLEN